MIKTILDQQLLKNSKKIILSFDDGPNPYYNVTENLLKILKKYQIHAAFCLVGMQVKQYPELVQAYVDDKHILVNHSYHHYFNHLLNQKQFWLEIEKCDQAIADALQQNNFQTQYYRPPFGILKPKQYQDIQTEKKLTPISFFINEAHATPDNFRLKIENIAKRLIANQGGAIVLHESRYSYFNLPLNKSWLPEAVEWLIKTLKQADMHFITYDEL